MNAKSPEQDAHVLLPDSVVGSIPALYATEHEADPVAHVKLFTPDAGWAWFITEFDPPTRTCFGLVRGLETELGYFHLDEIEQVRGGLNLPVERDLYFQPTRLSEILRDLSLER